MFKFLEANDFIYDLQNELYSDINEIVLIFFKISYKKYFKKIYPLLLMQLDLGAKVTLYLDGIFSKESFKGFRLPLFKKNKKYTKELEFRNKAFENLISKGAQIKYFNEPKNFIQKNFFTFAGRDHRKFIYIKKKSSISVSYFGATNLHRSKSNDYMIKSINSALNDKLLELNLRIFDNLRKENVYLDLKDYGSNGEIIIDSGSSNSLIYKKALSLIDNAKNRIIFISQLPPEPHLLFYFCKATLRGVSINILITNPKIYSFYIKLAYYFAKFISFMFKMKLSIVNTGYTHAKLLISDDKFIIGSHNFSFIGVIAGTIEMSMISDDKSLMIDLENFVEKLSPNK